MTTAGEKAVIEKDGKRSEYKAQDAADVQAKYKEHEWNTLEIIAEGDQLVQKINGHHFATLVDQDAEMSRRKGFIAFQDHGKGCTVAFRNIRLKEITAHAQDRMAMMMRVRKTSRKKERSNAWLLRTCPKRFENKLAVSFPINGSLAVERSRDDGQVNYHVMFEVDGAEAGLRMTSRGEILDRWHFQDEETASSAVIRRRQVRASRP